MSWRHFKYGVTHLQRLRAREKLLVSGAVAAAQTTREFWEPWREEQLRVAEMNSD